MLKSIKGLSGWHYKYYRVIYRLWRLKIMKQDESDGDAEFTIIIKLGGKLTNY
jgi:hypothetical protein